MKMQHLRDLLAVAEKGSINAAARHLGVSQPALSRSIRELEKEMGVPLLERQATGAALTPMGNLFVRRASTAVNELRRARDEIQQLQGTEHGTVVAGVSSMAHLTLLHEALGPFTQRYPNVVLRVIEGVFPMIDARIRSGQVDFYVGPAPEGGTPPGLQSETLFPTRRVVLVRRGHPLAQARSLAELTEASWITTSLTSQAEHEFSGVFSGRGLKVPKLALQTESALSWITAILATDMLVMVPKTWLASPLTKDLVVAIPIEETLAGSPISLVRRSSVPPTPAGDHLCDLLRRAASRIDVA
ncbi:LysR substrate-binding domain-containing protein [Burkholderia sp. 22PA0106]|uniref:LysR substrate-binding domain-containing protein n=1 Tax=Burkholderia sp. 22PA0106 TaxID=3237371 RepID=UPI0039C01EFB